MPSMFSIKDLKPAKAMYDSAQKDKDSILMLHTMLNHHHINDSRLEYGGTQDNVDGYIALLDDEDWPEGRVYVQVKHLTYPPKNGKAFYDIPGPLLGYAGRFKLDVILFVTCDTDNNTFYWKCIDDSFIEECLQKGLQGTYRYYFKDNESATAATVDDTLDQWRRLYQSKMDSIKGETDQLYEFMSIQRKAFNQTPSAFYGVEGSFVMREEIDTLYDWVVKPLAQGDSSLKLLVGEAGVGKTVVIKSLIEKLEKDGIKALSIKADRINIAEETSGPLLLQSLQSSLNLLSSQFDQAVLIVDQIDALSQNLSNDRDKLNALLDAIASLRIQSPKFTRIIVSCRKYDLIYDSSLKTLGIDNAIELGKLKDAEVKAVLDRLSPGLFERLSQRTKELLRKAQLLDMFCRLYVVGHRHTKYENEIALFDELWLHLTNDCPASLESSDVEGFLYSISDTIQHSETLSPYWTPSADEYPIMQYLASEGVLRVDGGQVSFFHQSFLDYSIARQYIQSGRSFVPDVENQFQGLEIRSNIKLVLDYLRSHSESHYKDALLALMESPKVRPHIKLIAVSVVASANGAFPYERKLVRELYQIDHQLYAAFLNGASMEWFPDQYDILYRSASGLTKDQDLFGPISFFLTRNAHSHSEEVVSFVNAVHEEDTRMNLAYYLLRGDVDYRKEMVKALYRNTVAGKKSSAADCIRKALDSDLDFAIEETGRLLLDYLLGDEKNHRDHDDYVLVEVICQKLYEEHPRRFFAMMVECFLQVVDKTSTRSIDWYSSDSVFGKYWVRDYPDKLFGWLVEAGKKEIGFSSSYVTRLLGTKSEKAISLALILMACVPSAFVSEIKEIVSDDIKLDNYLEYSDFRYHFLELLRIWYLGLGLTEKEWYQKRVLLFHSYTDSIVDKERRYGRPLYYCLWRRKWELVYTIGDEGMSEGLRRCKLELRRRYGGDFDNPKRSPSVTMARVCGGIVSSEVYKTFSKKARLHSFYGIKEHRPGPSNEWIPVDDRVHAKEFSNCVSANPSAYSGFVTELFSNERVSDRYRFSGLDGLLKGGCDPEELQPLFRHFINEGFVSQNAFDFFELSSRFARVGEMEDDLFRFYRKTIISGVCDNPEKVSGDSVERKPEEMLNSIVNKTSGRALEALIELASDKKMRERVYKELGFLCEWMNPEMRLLVFYKIYSREYYEESPFNSLLDTYLPQMGTELLLLRPDLIQRYLYFDTSRILSYVERIHMDRLSHEMLAQVYFFGFSHSSVRDYCLSRLEDILVIGDEKMVSKMVEVAYNHIQDAEFSKLSEEILLRFANDDRTSVRSSYLLLCNNLPVSSFPLFMSLSSNWKPSKMNEWYSVLEYVLRCCSVYPVECYSFVHQHKIIGQEEPWRYEDELVKVLLAIYKKLKYNDDREMLEKLMDLFDELILMGNRTVVSALETMS